MRPNQYGRSMVEMLGVLSVVGILSVAGVSGYSKAMLRLRNDQLLNQFNELTMSLRSLFANQKNFENLSDDIIVMTGVLPSDMRVEEEGSITRIIHAQGGEIHFFPSIGLDNQISAFEMYAQGLNRDACVALVTLDWGKDPTSGFRSMYIGYGEVTEALMTDVFRVSDADPSSGIYTAGQGPLSLPLTIPEAISACDCPVAPDCVVGLKYFR